MNANYSDERRGIERPMEWTQNNNKKSGAKVARWARNSKESEISFCKDSSQKPWSLNFFIEPAEFQWNGNVFGYKEIWVNDATALAGYAATNSRARRALHIRIFTQSNIREKLREEAILIKNLSITCFTYGAALNSSLFTGLWRQKIIILEGHSGSSPRRRLQVWHVDLRRKH